MLEKLKNGIVEVEFVKKNGDKRFMICTLKKELLPETKGNKRDLPENLITVFDLEVQDWRMINLDTLISFKEVE